MFMCASVLLLAFVPGAVKPQPVPGIASDASNVAQCEARPWAQATCLDPPLHRRLCVLRLFCSAVVLPALLSAAPAAPATADTAAAAAAASPDDVARLLEKAADQVQQVLEEGRAALSHLEHQLINIQCMDPGATVGLQLVLPLLQHRLDVEAARHQQASVQGLISELIAQEEEEKRQKEKQKLQAQQQQQQRQGKKAQRQQQPSSKVAGSQGVQSAAAAAVGVPVRHESQPLTPAVPVSPSAPPALMVTEAHVSHVGTASGSSSSSSMSCIGSHVGVSASAQDSNGCASSTCSCCSLSSSIEPVAVLQPGGWLQVPPNPLLGLKPKGVLQAAGQPGGTAGSGGAASGGLSKKGVEGSAPGVVSREAGGLVPTAAPPAQPQQQQGRKDSRLSKKPDETQPVSKASPYTHGSRSPAGSGTSSAQRQASTAAGQQGQLPLVAAAACQDSAGVLATPWPLPVASKQAGKVAKDLSSKSASSAAPLTTMTAAGAKLPATAAAAVAKQLPVGGHATAAPAAPFTATGVPRAAADMVPWAGTDIATSQQRSGRHQQQQQQQQPQQQWATVNTPRDPLQACSTSAPSASTGTSAGGQQPAAATGSPAQEQQGSAPLAQQLRAVVPPPRLLPQQSLQATPLPPCFSYFSNFSLEAGGAADAASPGEQGTLGVQALVRDPRSQAPMSPSMAAALPTSLMAELGIVDMPCSSPHTTGISDRLEAPPASPHRQPSPAVLLARAQLQAVAAMAPWHVTGPGTHNHLGLSGGPERGQVLLSPQQQQSHSSVVGAEPPPAHFVCPLTRCIMYEPVACSDGYLYEHKAIADWLAGNAVSPMTGQPLSDPRLIVVLPLRAAIMQWCTMRGWA